MPQTQAAVPQRASFLALGAAAFIVSADARVIDPLLLKIAQEFHTSTGDASIVISAYTLPYGLFQLVYGPLGDRIGKLKVMASAFSVFCFGTFICGFVQNLAVFALLRFLTGVAAAALIPLSLAYIADKSTYEERQASLAKFMSALMMGLIMSAAIGGIFGERIGWRGVFYLFGVLGAFVSLIMWKESNRSNEAAIAPSKFGKETWAPFLRIWKDPASRLVVCAVGLEGFFFFAGYVYLAAYFERVFGLSNSKAGLMISLFGLGGLIYTVFVKKLLAKIGENGLLMAGAGALAVGWLAIVGLHSPWAMIPFIMLLGLGFYTFHSTLQTKATEMAPGARGVAVSLFAFCFFLGQSSGTYTGGRLLGDNKFTTVFLFSAAGLLVLGVFCRTMFPRLKKAAA